MRSSRAGSGRPISPSRFSQTARPLAVENMGSLVAAARMVRQELARTAR
jgi:hypothetical protein